MNRCTIDITTPDGTVRRCVLDRPSIIGRTGDPAADVAVDDERVAGRHAVLVPVGGGVRIDDLGSPTGTTVDGRTIGGPTVVPVGGEIVIGATRLRVVEPAAPATRRTLERDGIAVDFAPGTAGERVAPAVLAGAARARARLSGFGSEAWGIPVRVHLVEPFPDPRAPDGWVAAGTVVDADAAAIWMVVTDDVAPEPVGRALACVFGRPLPAHDELAWLIQGYGLHAGDAPDPDADLTGRTLPPVATADGDLAAALSVSFVRYLLGHGGDDALRRFLATARPGAVDDAARTVWGASMGELDARWRAALRDHGTEVAPATFLRLSLSFLRPHWRRQSEVFVLLLVSLGFTTTLPFVTQRLLDTALPRQDWGQVAVLLGLLGAVFVVSLFAQVRQRYLSAYVSGSIVRELRGRMFARMQEQSKRWFGEHDQGDVLSRFFGDAQVVETGLSTLLSDSLFQIVSLAVALVVCFTLDWRLALIVAIGAPVIGLVYRRMSAGAMTRSLDVQERAGALMSVTTENLQAHEVVSAFSLRDREVARFDAAAAKAFTAEVRMSLFGGWFMLSVQLVVTVLRLVVMGVGAWLILDGELSIGAYVAFLGVMGQVLEPVAGLTTLGQEMQASMGALTRVQEVMGAVPDVRDRTGAVGVGPLERELRLEGVTFGYSSDHRVLDGIDLVVPAGTRLAVVGPSGSGKSSLLLLMRRAADPDGGRITWDGVALTDARLDDLRARTGVVFQEAFAFAGSVRDNIRLGRPDATDAEVEAAARAAELHDAVLALPDGYDTDVGERGGMLSGGQRQRLALARALVRNPSLLLLDEPTSALDARTERLVAATLDRVSQGRTTVAVTHRLGTIVGYEQIVVVVGGRVVERGTHPELLALGGTYASLWAEQHGSAAPDAPADRVEERSVLPTGNGRPLTRLTGSLRRLPPPTPQPLPPPDRASRAATATMAALRRPEDVR